MMSQTDLDLVKLAKSLNIKAKKSDLYMFINAVEANDRAKNYRLNMERLGAVHGDIYKQLGMLKLHQSHTHGMLRKLQSDMYKKAAKESQ